MNLFFINKNPVFPFSLGGCGGRPQKVKVTSGTQLFIHRHLSQQKLKSNSFKS